jgi:hypothetical protein
LTVKELDRRDRPMHKIAHTIIELSEIAHIIHSTVHDLHHITPLQAATVVLAIAAAVTIVVSARAH